MAQKHCLWMAVILTVFIYETAGATTRYATYRYKTTSYMYPGVTAAPGRTTGTVAAYAATTTRRKTTSGYGTATTAADSYQTHYGMSGTISDYHDYYSSAYTYYHHIDNPNNYPVVLHFTSMSLDNCPQCSCESVEIYPHDWPYNTNVQKFCGSSLPNGNGHVYVPSLGTIAFHARSYYRSSSYSLRYELLSQGATVTTPGYNTNYMYYTTGGYIGKSKLLQMLLNMQHQLDALSEEAKLAYDLAHDNTINNYAKRSVNLLASDTEDKSDVKEN